MSKYGWANLGPREQSIADGRSASEANDFDADIGRLSEPARSQAILTELLVSTRRDVFNVKSFGAKGDGTTDDTAAIVAATAKAAIGAGTDYEGGIVVFPAGIYGVTADLELPQGVQWIGMGSRSTRIRWISPSVPDVAVVTSNLAGEYSGEGFIFCTAIKGIRIECVGVAPVGLKLAGWNEGCTLEDVEATQFLSKGLWLRDALAPASKLTQNTTLKSLRMIPVADNVAAETAVGYYLQNVRRVVFQSLTCDQGSNATAHPTGIGLQLYSGCEHNIFLGMNVEDCAVPIDIGAGGNCEANDFDGILMSAHGATVPSQTIGSYTGTMGIIVRTGTKRTTFRNIKDEQRYDYLMVDQQRNRAYVSAGLGPGTVTFYSHLVSGTAVTTGADAGSVILTDAEHLVPRFVGGVVSVASTTTNINVQFAQTIQVSTSGGDVVISGLAGGVAGQRVTIYKTTASNRLILRNQSGSATQQFFFPNNVDLTFGGTYGGITLEFNGTGWFLAGQSNSVGSVSVSSDQTALDVSGVAAVHVSTSGGDVNLYGFANGVAGQTLDIIKTTSANKLIIQHNDASGTQKIFSPTGADLTLTNFGGLRLRFNGTNWFPASPGLLNQLPVSSDRGDASQTLTVGTDSPTQRWATTLTATRTVTLSTTGAVNGDRFRIVRTAGGAFNLVVASTENRTLRKDEWCEVAYDGSTWRLVATGSLEVSHQVIDGWYQDNVTASQTNVELTRSAGRWHAIRAGSVTGVSVKSTEARTAGTLTVDVFKNTGLSGAAGSSLGFALTLDGTATSFNTSFQTRDQVQFNAGDELYAVVTTTGAWTPTTADIRVEIEITPE